MQACDCPPPRSAANRMEQSKVSRTGVKKRLRRGIYEAITRQPYAASAVMNIVQAIMRVFLSISDKNASTSSTTHRIVSGKKLDAVSNTR